jgi:hypothetical protein
MSIGATWNPDLAKQVGAVMGKEMAALGFNLYLGPSLDVIDSPQIDSGEDLGVRTFGGDPYWVGKMGQAYISGLHEGSKSRAKALQHAEYCLLAAGFAAALAYLTRPNALAFIAALVLVLLVSRAWRSLALFLFPCAAMLAIWFALVWAVKGDPFYSVQNHHLRVAYITDGMRAGWGAHIPTAAEFARTHSIPKLIASSAWKYITFLFSPMYFSFLAIGLLALPALLPRRNLMVLALAGLLHFVLVGATWSTFEPDRLLHPVFVCLLPLCLIAPCAALQWALARWRWQASRARIARAALALLLAAAALGLAATGYATGLRARQYYIAHMLSAPPLTPDHRLLAYRFLLPDAVIATDDPFLCNLRIDRPTIYFPEKITEQNAPDFFRQFMVRFVALTNPQDPKVQPVLSALVAQGALQPLSQSFDPAFQWFLVNETIFDKTAPAK